MKKSFFKKSTSMVIALIFLISMVMPVYAADNAIKVQLNGQNMSFDVAPQLVNNRVLVPMRAIFETLGANVEWDDQTRTVTATKDEIVIKLVVNSKKALLIKNGNEKEIQLDTAPVIVNGRTLVPIRFISESLGKQVGWDSAKRTVIIIDYDYFIEAFKTQAPNFYEYVSNQYDAVNTGEFNFSLDTTCKYTGLDPRENISGNINANFNAKLNPESGSMDAVMKITGFSEVLEDMGLEKFDTITYNVIFDNNSFYFKTNLFALLAESGINLGDKWLKADIKDMGISDVNNLQDLKDMQNKQPADQFNEALVNNDMQLNVDSFAQFKAVFNALVTLVDNDHFKVTNSGDTKVYSWKINKQDLLNVVLNIEKNKGSFKDLTLQDLAEMKQIVDSLVFDFNMEVEVKNNIAVGSKFSMNMHLDIPDKGKLELYLKGDSKLSNPNTGSYVIIIPSSNNVININDLFNSY